MFLYKQLINNQKKLHFIKVYVKISNFKDFNKHAKSKSSRHDVIHPHVDVITYWLPHEQHHKDYVFKYGSKTDHFWDWEHFHHLSADEGNYDPHCPVNSHTSRHVNNSFDDEVLLVV